MSVDPVQFRNTMAQWASGVTVVTTAHDGKLYGMTASSFSSVSLTPPLILVCVAKYAYTHSVIVETGSFAVNILSDDQLAIGKRFAERLTEYVDRFTDLDVSYSEKGAPLLAGATAWLDCRISETVDAGDHTIFVADVVASQINGGEPLLYVNRTWGSFTPMD